MRDHRFLPLFALLAMLLACAPQPAEQATGGGGSDDDGVATTPADQDETRTVRARVQSRPGGPVEDVEMTVHPVPVEPETVPAGDVDLDDDELVVGVVADGVPVAYPVRYLALSEVVNDRVGEASITPTW